MTDVVQGALELTAEQSAVVLGAMVQVDRALNADPRRRDFFVAVVTSAAADRGGRHATVNRCGTCGRSIMECEASACPVSLQARSQRAAIARQSNDMNNVIVQANAQQAAATAMLNAQMQAAFSGALVGPTMTIDAFTGDPLPARRACEYLKCGDPCVDVVPPNWHAGKLTSDGPLIMACSRACFDRMYAEAQGKAGVIVCTGGQEQVPRVDPWTMSPETMEILCAGPNCTSTGPFGYGGLCWPCADSMERAQGAARRVGKEIAEAIAAQAPAPKVAPRPAFPEPYRPPVGVGMRDMAGGLWRGRGS